MGQRFVVLVLFVGLFGICFCGCENQGQKVERLIKELQHRKAKVRANAAMALALFYPPNAAEGAVPALIPLLQDEDANVRADAIYALGSIGESTKNARPVIVPALIQALHQDARVRANVAMALMQIGTPETLKALKTAVPDLIQALQDRDKGVRADAAEALGMIGEGAKDAVSALIKLLQDEGIHVRASVARALVQIGTPDAIKAVKDTVSVLIQALQNQDGIVRVDTAYVLGAIGESAKDTVPALIQALQHQEVRQCGCGRNISEYWTSH